MSDQKKSTDTSKITQLFDIRLVVGGLLSVYGIILTIKGLFDTDAEVRKGAGLHLNLWTGIALLVVGLIMLAWMRLRPLEPLLPDDLVKDEGPRKPRGE
jgi:hypothetical protein